MAGHLTEPQKQAPPELPLTKPNGERFGEPVLPISKVGRVFVIAGPGQPGIKVALRPIPPIPIVAAAPMAGVPQPVAAVLPDWCASDAINQANAIAGVLANAPVDVWQERADFRRAADGTWGIPGWLTSAFAIAFLRPLVITVAHIVRAPFWCMDNLTKLVPFPGRCQIARLDILFAWRWYLRIPNFVLGGALDRLISTIDHTVNYICPSQPVDPDDVIDGFLRDRWTLTEAEDWGKVHDRCPPATNEKIQARKYWPTIQEVIERYHRGMIPTRAACEAELRKCGVLTVAEQDKIIDSAWRLLDRGDILDAFHRLRPGRDPSGIVYTQHDAQADLQKLGYQKREVDIIIALSYATVTHRRLMQPYKEGLISWQDLTEYMADDRTQQRDIQTLQPFMDFEQKLTLREQTGAPAPPALAKELAAGSVSVGEYTSEMQARGYQPQTISAGEAEAQAQRGRDLRAACIAGERAKLRSGASSPAQVAIALHECGVDPGIANSLITEWAIERANGSRPASTADLCTWVSNGWMSVTEYSQRLAAIGYSVRDIRRIIDTCGLKQRQRDEARRAKAAKATASEVKARIAAAKVATAAKLKEIKALETGAKGDIGTAKTVAASVKARAAKDTAATKETAAPASPADVSGTATSSTSASTDATAGIAASTVSGDIGAPALAPLVGGTPVSQPVESPLAQAAPYSPAPAEVVGTAVSGTSAANQP
jgi:hypothetical protein